MLAGVDGHLLSGAFVERRRAPPAAPPARGWPATVWWVSAALIVVLCAALVWTLRPATREAATPPAHGSMLAVLPLANLTGDPAQDYFSDGITEDIITELSRFSELFVIARNSSFAYRGKSVDVRKIGRELGVRYVLEGAFASPGTGCALRAS